MGFGYKNDTSPKPFKTTFESEKHEHESSMTCFDLFTSVFQFYVGESEVRHKQTLVFFETNW